MAVYISTPERIDELFEEIEESPEDDYRLAVEFRENLVKHMQSETLDKSFVQDWLNDIETDHAILDGIAALCSWRYEDDEFAAAQDALDQFDTAVADAREKNWKNLAMFSLEQLVDLKAELSGFTPQGELQTAVDILHEDYDGADVHLGNASRLIDLVTDHSRGAEQDTFEQAFAYCDRQADLLHDAGNFHSERNRLDQALELAQVLEEDVAPLQDRYIDSWETERETECERGTTRDHALLQQTIEECRSFASSATIQRWEAELQAIAPSVVDDMTPIESTVEIPTELIDALIEDVEEIAERESQVYALFSLIQMRPHVMSIPKRDSEQPDGLTDVLPRKKISKMGASTSSDYKMGHELAHAFAERFVASVFTELFDRDIFGGEAVVDLVEYFDGVGEDDIAFTEEIVDQYVAEDHVAAFYIGVPHFERVLLNLLNHRGESILVEHEQGTRTNSLGTLIEKLRPYTNEEYVSYLDYMYTDPEGQNRRNLAAHGHLSYGEIDVRFATTVLLDLLSVGCDLCFDDLVAELGTPETLDAWTSSEWAL